MTRLKTLAAAATLAIAGGVAMAGPAAAAPVLPGAALPEAIAATGAAGAVPAYHHWRQRCWPVYRWVWTHWGWRYLYVGTRCRPPRHW